MKHHHTLALFAALALAGCNASREPVATSAPRYSSITPSDFKLPDGAGCSGAVARYQAVMDNDKRMGHVGDGVYTQVSGEIAAAASACSAGRDGEAQRLVAASKARHGYPS